jgi:hypothetical protein
MNRLYTNAKYFIITVSVLFSAFSCDSFVDVELPSSQLTKVTVFEDMTTAAAALSGLYAKMRTNGILTGNAAGMSCYLGLYADEFDYYQQGTVSPFYNNSLYAGESGVGSIWNQSYNQIYAANAIIEGVSRSMALPESGRNQLKGEALFVRALLHFYLVNLYGDVPYITATDYDKNKKAGRTPSAAVYNNMVNDLTEAVALLPAAYVTAERVRPNRSAASALLARVYLYMGAYAEAANEASAVINNPLYIWETDLNKTFLKGSTATIWQFMPNVAGANTQEGSLYIFVAGPPPIVGLKPSFAASFAANDKRKLLWTAAVTTGGSTWYHAFKYKQKNSTGTSVEYSIVLRLAEQYLIRAEARARQGELISAKDDLNLIRRTAGLDNTAAVTAAEIVSDVLAQRKFELFTEFGQRFFDLKRTGLLDVTLSVSKPGWNSEDQLWPLPALELSANPNLNPQNPKY